MIVNYSIKSITDEIISYKEYFSLKKEDYIAPGQVVLEKGDWITIDQNPKDLLINEKEKISTTFSRYIIENCGNKEVHMLRKFVEEYEYNVKNIIDNDLEISNNIKELTVFLDLMFGIDVTYLDTLKYLLENDFIENLFRKLGRSEENEIKYNRISEKLADRRRDIV